jgi:hypothetical protein
MLQPVWEGLAHHKWPDAQLAALDEELAKLDFPAAYRLGLRGELAGQSDEMDLLRRHPERVEELGGLRDFLGKNTDVSLPGALAARLVPAGWFYQNQYRSARMLEEYSIPVVDASRGTFYPAVARRGEAALAAESASPFNLLARLILPAQGQAATRLAYGQASVDLARTALALERCRLAQGAFPEALDALAPQFIAKVPHDVIGGQPLKYRREADGSFVLYSVGWNETDDGGVAGIDKDGAVDMQSGDWVWGKGD